MVSGAKNRDLFSWSLEDRKMLNDRKTSKNARKRRKTLENAENHTHTHQLFLKQALILMCLQ